MIMNRAQPGSRQGSEETEDSLLPTFVLKMAHADDNEEYKL